MSDDAEDTQTQADPAPAKKLRLPFPFPWGLLVGLGLYALAVLGYVWATYWRTPEFQAGEHVEAAMELLGGDDGARLSQPQMEEAFVHLLEAGRLVPRDRWVHERLQLLRVRMDERKLRLSPELVRRAEAIALLLERIENEEAPTLVVGLRDRKWTARDILTGPKNAVLWSIPGGVIIVLLWSYRAFTERRVRGDEREAGSQKRERELEDLERARTIGSVNEDGSPRKTRGGDVLMQGREKKPRPTGAGAEPKPRATGAGAERRPSAPGAGGAPRPRATGAGAEQKPKASGAGKPAPGVLTSRPKPRKPS